MTPNGWPINPFPKGEPDPRDEMFFDREEQLHSLRSALTTRERVVLVEGPRRMGKSSLLQRFEKTSTDLSTILYVDLRLLDYQNVRYSSSGVTREILRIVGTSLARLLGINVGQQPSDFTPDGFREAVLPKLALASSPQRLCVLFDETELLYEESSSSILEVLRSCFVSDTSIAPLLVFSWGRPLGAFANASAAEWLKAATTVSVAPFDEELTKAIPTHAKQYQFTAAATTVLWELTHGHPLWVTALNHKLYLDRSLANRRDDVEPDEVLGAVRKTCQLIDKGVWYAWEQLTPLQSLTGRAIADLTCTDGKAMCTSTATISSIQEQLATFTEAPSSTRVLEAVLALQHNSVVETRADGYILCAPILGAWLRGHTIENLKRAAGSDADHLVSEARESLTLGRHGAARQKLDEALAIDSTHIRACLLMATLHETEGHLDKAIELLSSLVESHQQTIAPALIALLKKRILEAISTKASPASWVSALARVSPNPHDLLELTPHIATYYLDVWEAAVRSGRINQAVILTDEFSATGISEWRSMLASRYAEVVSGFRDSEAMLMSALDAVLYVFPKLTDGPLDYRVTEEDRTLQELRTRFRDDQHAIEVLSEYSIERQRVPRWWRATVELIQFTLAKDLDIGDRTIRVQILQDLAMRMPEELRNGFLSTVGIHLTRRLYSLLRRDIEEAVAAVRLLCGLPVYDLGGVSAQLEDYILDLTTDAHNDDAVVNFFMHASSMYLILLDAPHATERSALAVLDQVELLFSRMRDPEDSVPAEDREWALFVRGWSGVQGWRDLLERSAFRGVQRVHALRTALAAPARVSERGQLMQMIPADAWAKEVTEVLAGRYHDLVPLDVTVPGIPRDLLKFYRASWNGELVVLKAYRLPKDPDLQHFLQFLWDSERRVLLEVSTRNTARALTRMRFAERLTERDDTLVIGIEAVGPRTLRGLIDRGRSGLLAETAKGALWHQIYSLVEGLDYLHRMHFLHRSIRSENVFIIGEDAKAKLKLGNFEWSVYLHNIAEVLPERRWLDRYSAPETIALRFGLRDRDQGESFTSDVYGLGLILFELLVRRLTPLELCRFQTADEYDPEAHEAWLAGLRAELDTKLRTPDELDQRLLIREMLEPSPRRRMADLGDTVEIIRHIAVHLAEVQSKLAGSKPVFCSTLYRQTRESIASFLVKYVDVSTLGSDSDALKRFLEEDLAGARLFRNIGDSDRPIFIEGKRVSFTIAPFEHEAKNRRRYFEEVPFLRVATQADCKGGLELGHLPSQVEVIDLRETRDRLDGLNREEILSRGKLWPELFDIAQTTEDSLPADLRRYHSILRLTADVEESLWSKQIEPYVVVEPIIPGKMTIKGVNEDGRALCRVVRSQLSRDERYFELTASSNPVASYDLAREWRYVKDGANGTIELSSQTSRTPPKTGFVRPSSLAGC